MTSRRIKNYLYKLESLLKQRRLIKEIIIVEDWTYEREFTIKKISDKFGCSYFQLPCPKSSPYDFRAAECRNLGFQKSTGDLHWTSPGWSSLLLI